MSFRKLLFWLHLVSGCVAGVIVLIMSVTGVLLTYEKQMLAVLERGPYRSAAPPGAGRLPVDALVKAVRDRGELPRNATLTLRSDPAEPAEIRAGRGPAIYVSPYTGQVLGESTAGGARAFFQKVTSWHRWLGVEGKGRATARAITGACNACFLILVATGAYLWLPRRWSWRQVRSVIWFRSASTGKARDFNWHNVFGVWSLIPLFFVVISALPMSYPWANDLLYLITGSPLPAPATRGGEGPGGNPGRQDGRSRQATPAADIDALWNRAARHDPAWKSITARLDVSGAEPVSFTIDAGNGGQPQKRLTLALHPATAATVKLETFADASRGRQLRMWTRFVHTGEYYGVIGQTIAGVASAAGIMLTWTGVSLALRRLLSWTGRRARKPSSAGEPVHAGTTKVG
jgi:uncharacterized iron-regulated membrane protein